MYQVHQQALEIVTLYFVIYVLYGDMVWFYRLQLPLAE